MALLATDRPVRRIAAAFALVAVLAGALGAHLEAPHTREFAAGVLAAADPARAAAATLAPAAVGAVEAVGITVSDADRSAEFFSRVLDFEKVSDVEIAGADYEHLEGVFGARVRVVRMKLGEDFIDLHEYLAPRGRPVPPDSRSNDRWFQHAAIVVSDMDRAYARLRENRVEHASSGPQTLPDWNPKAGRIRAFYFKDDDGHVLEVIQFPPGKGDPRWQRADGRLFRGIDHTAIVVGDTDSSLAFYRDTLGMTVAGESENWGTEQEHLNNVFGARLRITTLRAARGPGVELLEYLSPRDGRAYPVDLRANDLAYWRTVLLAPDLERAQTALRNARSAYVSPGSIAFPKAELRFTRGLTVRDPDGHALVLATR